MLGDHQEDQKEGESVSNKEANLILAGVGGQGILSLAYVICNAALSEGLNFKQAEVHGMAQRGGAVQSHLRISDKPIASDLIPQGTCDLLIAVEPLESLRYLHFLKPSGAVVTSKEPFVNIPNYPEQETIWEELKKVEHALPIDAARLAREAGSSLAQGMVMLGAASLYLPLDLESLKAWTVKLWAPKGQKVVDTNLTAFRLGREQATALSKSPQEAA